MKQQRIRNQHSPETLGSLHPLHLSIICELPSAGWPRLPQEVLYFLLQSVSFKPNLHLPYCDALLFILLTTDRLQVIPFSWADFHTFQGHTAQQRDLVTAWIVSTCPTSYFLNSSSCLLLTSPTSLQLSSSLVSQSRHTNILHESLLVSANSKGLIHASYVQWLLATVPVDLHLVCATFGLQKTRLRAVSCLGSTLPWVNTILTYPMELHPICFRLVSPFTWGPSFSVRVAVNHTNHPAKGNKLQRQSKLVN